MVLFVRHSVKGKSVRTESRYARGRIGGEGLTIKRYNLGDVMGIFYILTMAAVRKLCLSKCLELYIRTVNFTVCKLGLSK